MHTDIDNFMAYLALEKKYAIPTLQAYASDLKQFKAYCATHWEGTSLRELGYPAIRGWIIALSTMGLSHATINRKISALKRFYKYALREGWVLQSPLSAHNALKKERRLQLPFSTSELGLLLNQLDQADDFEGVRDQCMLELLYATGMRRSELISLRVSDVDLSQSWLKVLGKRNKERLIPMLPSLVKVFLKYMAQRATLQNVTDDTYVFLTVKGRKMSPSLVYRRINTYLSTVSEKQKKSPHMLRHSFATHLLDQGADIFSVKDLLGHSSLASTQVYTHTSLAALKDTVRQCHPRNRPADE